MPGDWRANTTPAAVPRASDPSVHSAVLAGIAPSACACLPAYLLRPVEPLGVACSTSQSVVNESLPFPDWTALPPGHQPKCYLSGRCLLCYPSHRSIHPAPPGTTRLPAGKNLGSDLSERPFCASEGRFRGGAPAPPMLCPSCPGRPARSANGMTDRALPRPRVLHTVPEQSCAAPRRCCAGVFSPQHWEPGVQTTRPHPVGEERA